MENSASKFIEEMNKVNEAMGVKKIETNDAIKPTITFSDYEKLDIRVCLITSVEKIEKYDRLYKLEVNTGVDTRTIVSGIAEQFTPEQLLNRKIPFVLNLEPRKVGGILSQGMIFLASDSNKKLFEFGNQDAEVGSKS
jgi:methionyl-tRNA synthetase